MSAKQVAPSGNQNNSSNCKMFRSQTDFTFSLIDVFGKEHFVYAQTGDDGKIRVITLPSEQTQLSPIAIEKLAEMVRNISVTVEGSSCDVKR